jgi:hypothetical protein
MTDSHTPSELRAKNWKPVRREMFAESSDPHFTGPIIVEFAPDGIRWWWSGTEENGEPDGHVTPEMLVENEFLRRGDELDNALRCARAYMAQAAKHLEALQKATSWRLI